MSDTLTTLPTRFAPSVVAHRTVPLPRSWLTEVAREFAAQPDLWRDKVRRGNLAERWYLPLYIGERHEIWLQGWPKGRTTELHDHGGSSGAMALITGGLTEVYVDGPRLRRRQLGAGGLSSFGPDHIHDVAGTSRKPALSIHVYSPRLESMTFYDFDPRAGLIPLRVEHDVHGAEIGDYLGKA